MTAVVSGRRRYAQWIVQSSSRIVAAAPDEPGDVPRQERPRREQRQHPRRVDVRQERAGRVVRVAAVEPDPDARPVRPRVGAGRLAAGDHARPARSANVRLSSTIAAIRRGSRSREASRRSARRKTPARRRVRRSRTCSSGPPADDPAPPARRARDGVQPRRVVLVGHRDGILARSPDRNADRHRVRRPLATVCSRIIRHIPKRKPWPKEPSSSSAARRTRSATGSSSAASSRSPAAATRRSRSSRPPRRSALEAGERYRAGLRRARASSGSARSTRSPGRRPTTRRAALAVRDATGIFLTGGNQLRLSSTIGGTRAGRRDPRAVPARRGRRRHVAPGRRAMSQPHDRVRGVGRDAQAPDGPDRGRSRACCPASSSTSTSSSGTGSAGCSA